jgi:hypothetical protein
MRALTAVGILALVAIQPIASPSAIALPLANKQVAPLSGIEFVAQKNRDSHASRRSKSKAYRVSRKEPKEQPKGEEVRYGSRLTGADIQINPRGAYLFSPSFNGVYVPPGGYSSSGYTIRYAD